MNAAVGSVDRFETCEFEFTKHFVDLSSLVHFEDAFDVIDVEFDAEAVGECVNAVGIVLIESGYVPCPQFVSDLYVDVVVDVKDESDVFVFRDDDLEIAAIVVYRAKSEFDVECDPVIVERFAGVSDSVECFS